MKVSISRYLLGLLINFTFYLRFILSYLLSYLQALRHPQAFGIRHIFRVFFLNALRDHAWGQLLHPTGLLIMFINNTEHFDCLIVAILLGYDR
jgi:hypothetical protein